MIRAHLTYIALAATTIAAGLLIHLHGTSLGHTSQDITGDALYAMMMTWWMGAIAPNAKLITRASAAYTTCAAIEFSQLWHAPAIDATRATQIGRLVLGSGFDARDLAAYALGVGIAASLEFAVQRRRETS